MTFTIHTPTMANVIERKLPLLTLPQLQTKCPAMFAEHAWSGASKKYKFFDTVNLLTALADYGWSPYQVSQARARKEEKQGFQKHSIRLRHRDAVMQAVGDTIFDLLLVNDHSGSSSYQLYCAMMTLRCTNGMMSSDQYIQPVRIPHTRLTEQAVIDAQFEVIDQIPVLGRKVKETSEIILTPDERGVFAEAALQLRWAPEENSDGNLISTAPIKADKILRSRRPEDAQDQNTLFRTTNIIQENLIRGGIGGYNRSGRYTHTRAVNSVNEDIKLNKALFVLMEKMQELKAASAA